MPTLTSTSGPKASREDVLRGITGGANGYITKPFENHILVAAVKMVLGLG
jgi:DNA-binding response OmpR family regulator